MNFFYNYVNTQQICNKIILLFFIANISLINSSLANPPSLESDRIEIEAGINNFECIQGNAWGYSFGSITAIESVEMLDAANEVAQSLANTKNNGTYMYNGYVKTLLDIALKESNAGFFAGETEPYYSSSDSYVDALNEWESDSEICEDIIKKIEYGAHIGIGRVPKGNTGEFWYSLLIFEEAPLQVVIPSFQNTINFDTDEPSNELPVLLLTDNPKKVSHKAMKSYQNISSSNFRMVK